MRHRTHLDASIQFIGTFLYGPGKGPSTLNSVRALGQPLVDDWGCLKSMVMTYPNPFDYSIVQFQDLIPRLNFELQVRVFETHCGSLTQYGMKHMRTFASICNSGVSETEMAEACSAACNGYEVGQLHPSNKGYSA